MNAILLRRPYSRTAETAHRWALLLVGLMLYGIGIAFMVRSGLGLGPWGVFEQGLARHLHIELGTVTIFVGVAVLLGWVPLGQRPGIGTVLNIMLIGLVLNVTLPLFAAPSGLVLRLIWLTIGIVIIGIASGLYLSARFGAGPRDGLMMGLQHRTGLSVRLVRTLIELTVLVVGWLLGGTVGVGTLAFALGIGPIVQWSLRCFGGLPR